MANPIRDLLDHTRSIAGSLIRVGDLVRDSVNALQRLERLERATLVFRRSNAQIHCPNCTVPASDSRVPMLRDALRALAAAFECVSDAKIGSYAIDSLEAACATARKMADEQGEQAPPSVQYYPALAPKCPRCGAPNPLGPVPT